MLTQILWGLAIMAFGVSMVVFARKFVEIFGMMASAEKFLGSGGTYSAIRIIGILLVVIGVLLMTGFLDNALLSILSGIGIIR